MEWEVGILECGVGSGECGVCKVCGVCEVCGVKNVECKV